MMSACVRPLIACDCLAVYAKVNGTTASLLYKDGPGANAFSERPIALGTGLSGWVIENERPIMNGNPTVEAHLLPGAGYFNSNSSALSIPLADESGTVFGALTLYSRRQAAFSGEHLRILQAVQLRFTLALQNAISNATTHAEPDAAALAGLSAS